jgi:hypothetical protein
MAAAPHSCDSHPDTAWTNDNGCRGQDNCRTQDELQICNGTEDRTEDQAIQVLEASSHTFELLDLCWDRLDTEHWREHSKACQLVAGISQTGFALAATTTAIARRQKSFWHLSVINVHCPCSSRHASTNLAALMCKAVKLWTCDHKA